MSKRILALMLFLASAAALSAQQYRTVVKPLEGEYWWGGVLNKGYLQPYENFNSSDGRFIWEESKEVKGGAGIPAPYDLSYDCAGGATMPLLLSSKGRYVWSERPFSYEFEDGVLILYSRYEKLGAVVAGKTLRDAYREACRKHFPFDGREPDEIMFTKPQFNNWIEIAINGINQKNCEWYTEEVAASGYPCGVIAVDGGWQRYHGRRDFNPEAFPDAAKIFDGIHSRGYKSMLWASYFLTADSRPEYVNYKPGAKNLLVRSRKNPKEAALVWWWNGISCTLDLTSPEIRKKFTDELKDFAERFHIDGFKFDGGNPEYFRRDGLFSELWMEGCDFAHSYNLVGESFPIHEFRSGFKTGGHPVVQRLHDISHSWKELDRIIPDVTVAGLLGYPYTFADMIGGGLSSSFAPGNTFSHKLFIRSCQMQALMPMMQFSALPWVHLTKEENEICRRFAELHVSFAPYIMEQVHLAAGTGEPIMRSMEYEFPGNGYENVNGQYMLGSKYLVAPVTSEDDSKTVYLPAGRWKDDLGKIHRGPKVLELNNVPVSRLPYFEKYDKD